MSGIVVGLKDVGRQKLNFAVCGKAAILYRRHFVNLNQVCEIDEDSTEDGRKNRNEYLHHKPGECKISAVTDQLENRC